MTDAEVAASWPDLGIVVRELRAIERAFGGIRPGNWLARRWRRLWRTK